MEYKRDNGTGFEYEFIKSSACEEYHCHNRIEIIYIKKGTIRLRTDMAKSVYDISVGDFAVISGTDVHRCFCMGECEYEMFRFPVSYQNMLDGTLIRGSFVVSNAVISENAVVNNALCSICNFLKQDNLAKSIERNLCSSLCSILTSFYDKRKKSDFFNEENKEGFDEFDAKQSVSFETLEKFDTVLLHIKENYTKTKINLEILSEVSGLNKTFLSALFPKLTGKNFKDYLNSLRVDTAIELLTSTEKNISEIAFLCGFDTIRTLNNVFKSIAGVTPSEIKAGGSRNKSLGIDTEISGVGSDIFNYKWTSTVETDRNTDEGCFKLFCKDCNIKRWSHLSLRMLFFKGRQYSVSFKAKTLDFTVHVPNVLCNFCFNDDVKKIEHHSPDLLEIKELCDGWKEYAYSYKVPDYYKPSSIDNFSVYTSPYNERAVGYLVKDIVVKLD